jgi:hypothetical protein
MTVNLDLPPNVGRTYLAEAQARGISIDTLFREVLLTRQPPIPAEEMSAEQWVQEFKTWVRSHPADLPLLSDEAIGRESIYGERGL